MGNVSETPRDETPNKEERVEIPSDEAITKEEEDLLNRRPFVEHVVSLIEANIKPPYSIGIYGDWGSGKTSIMRLIKEKLEATGKYRIIWFDAWEYENEANLIYPLVRLIQKEIPRSRFKKVAKGVRKIFYVLTKAGLEVAARLSSGDVIGIGKLEKYEADYFKKYARVFDNWIDQVGRVKEEFKVLTQAACEPKEKKEEKKECIIIFIDDLDRCLPENSIKILESIKNIFSQGNCIFILGVDKKTIARVIEGRYPTLTDGECKDYLAKIVPFGFDVPECEVLDFDKYFKYLMYDKLKIDPQIIKVDLSKIPNICVSSRLHNPRKLKRALITFYLYTKIKQSGGFHSDLSNDMRKVGVDDQDVLMFSLLCEFWSDLFERVLISNHELAELTAIARNRGFRDWTTEFSDERTHPIIKNFAADHNLYQFLWGWQNPQTDDFVNVLIRVGKLMGLRKK